MNRLVKVEISEQAKKIYDNQKHKGDFLSDAIIQKANKGLILSQNESIIKLLDTIASKDTQMQQLQQENEKIREALAGMREIFNIFADTISESDIWKILCDEKYRIIYENAKELLK